MSDANHPHSQQAAANARLRGAVSAHSELRRYMDALKSANIEMNQLRQRVAELEGMLWQWVNSGCGKGSGLPLEDLSRDLLDHKGGGNG